MNQKKLLFLYVLLIKNANNIDTTVYKNLKYIDTYLNMNSNAPTANQDHQHDLTYYPKNNVQKINQEKEEGV